MKEFMNLLVKLGPGDLNRQDEPRIQGESWKRIKARAPRSPQSGKWRMVSTIRLNVVSEISRLLNIEAIR